MIGEEIWKALGYLFMAGILATAYNLAHDSKLGRNKLLMQGLLICAGLALFASFTLGQPTCIDEETDNRGSTCYEYADDGYTPTTEQRVAKFFYFMTLLGVPVVAGALSRKMPQEM